MYLLITRSLDNWPSWRSAVSVSTLFTASVHSVYLVILSPTRMGAFRSRPRWRILIFISVAFVFSIYSFKNIQTPLSFDDEPFEYEDPEGHPFIKRPHAFETTKTTEIPQGRRVIQILHMQAHENKSLTIPSPRTMEHLQFQPTARASLVIRNITLPGAW